MTVDQRDESAPEHADAARLSARLRTDVVDGPVDVESLVSWATTPSTGAVVTFTGTVRDHSQELRDVVAIDYEVFERGAQARMLELGARALDTFPGLGRVALVHRRGHVVLGEGSVWVVVSAAHRVEAFEAATYCIDVLKETVPVWKREVVADGGSTPATGTPVVDLETAHRRWFERRALRDSR